MLVLKVLNRLVKNVYVQHVQPALQLTSLTVHQLHMANTNG